MPVAAKLPSKQMNNFSEIRKTECNKKSRWANIYPSTPTPNPILSAQRTGSPTIYFNGSQNMIAFRNAFVPPFMCTQTK